LELLDGSIQKGGRVLYLPIKATLNSIRNEPSSSLTIQQKILQVLLSFALGVFLGFIAKYSDTIPSNGLIGNIWGTISE
jgi:hypothetical protein